MFILVKSNVRACLKDVTTCSVIPFSYNAKNISISLSEKAAMFSGCE